MFAKQIDKKTALELAAKGKEVLVMVPAGKDSGWEGMTPDTLGHILEGCMFFRREPAMEVDQVGSTGQTIEIGPAEPGNAQPDPPPTGKKAKKTVDVGKLIALHNAGWSVAKIADELGVSTRAVYNYLPSKD